MGSSPSFPLWFLSLFFSLSKTPLRFKTHVGFFFYIILASTSTVPKPVTCLSYIIQPFSILTVFASFLSKKWRPIWGFGYVQLERRRTRRRKRSIKQVLFMDWGWGTLSGKPTFREKNHTPPPPTSFSDSIGSSNNNEEPILEGSSQESSSSNGSSKRTRILQGTQNQSCLVDGCDSDLKNCKEYHRRHRVCDSHSKTPVVMVRGEEKRFCQQCSR